MKKSDIEILMSEANTEYGAEYKHGGKTWGITYFAKDDDDARRMLKSITESAVFLGQVMGRIPYGGKDDVDEFTYQTKHEQHRH